MNFLKISFFLYFVALQSNLHAYADPGTGSFIIQMLIAFIGSVIVFLKSPRFFIKQIFNRFKNYIFGKKISESEDNNETKKRI